MTDNADIETLNGLQLGRQLMRELGGEEQARLCLSALLMVRGWSGTGEVRINVRDGQVTTIQPAPVLRRGCKLPPPTI